MFLNAFLARKSTRIVALSSAAAMLLSACASPVAGPSGLYAQPTGNAPVTANPTPYSAALVCLAEYARKNNVNAPRIAVGRIADYTGKEESDGSGRKITQGASLMAMSALAKAGVPLVERFDTSVSELELKYANNKLISDNPSAQADMPAEYRRILAGQVPGSDFYIAGGITELNFNIRSSGLDAGAGGLGTKDLKGGLSGRVFIMNVGLDLRLVNTRTLEVVDVISYQKQIVAHEVSANFFKISGNTAFDLSAGDGALEPLQLGVRSVIERATVEMVANLYGMPGPQACMTDDPFGHAVTTGATGAFVPAYNNLETNNAATRQDPARWNDGRDPDVAHSRRDRY
ncbi:MAG: holdfast anchoring protein HfaB [Proteobacteria bacterium]|nr:holdfast anchoring protein HfaB [Pseudomonadota bacterium]